jgi:hypothetical protein
MKKLEKSLLAPMPLADEALTVVSGARRRASKLFRNSPVTNVQGNFSGPIVQVAEGNYGDVTQAAFVAQSNSVSF